MEANNYNSLQPDGIDWDNVHGPVSVPMTNDYLFRALLQRNNDVLKALVCALLHLEISDARSVRITNPIILGNTIEDKDFILDILVELNQNSIIDLELQVTNEGNWLERSMCYLCRAFDNLNKGDEYDSVKPAIHIGLLDYTLFPESPEFYATYWMMNENTYQRYSDKMRLSVLDLTHIELATEEDKAYHIDYWARLFKSTTWEDIKMLAKSDKYIKEAAEEVYQITQDEQIRQQCEAREDYRRRTAGRERKVKQQAETIKQHEDTIEQQANTINQLTNEKDQLAITNKQQEDEIERLRQQLREHGIECN